MSSKKYTEEQLRIAREIVDQEEAIEVERKARAVARQKLEAQAKREKKAEAIARAKVAERLEKKKRNAKPKLEPRNSTQFKWLISGPIFFWILNASLGLFAMSGKDGLYYHFWWFAPLLWVAICLWVWATPYDAKQVEKPPFGLWLPSVVSVLFLIALAISLASLRAF
jgi:hypothetical protein